MNALIEKSIDGLKLDRSEWKLVKFGDVAIQQKESVERENTELTRYVKGEHMYSEDLHLREWGELTDEYLGPAFIRKFEEGDILYGSRRTYLRKVVIAPFDGITSNTTFVIKANEKKIDKRVLPFVMMSEGFTQHSIKNSKGSVNPYVNWKDLSGYEFLLPPKEQQAKIAELLWAIDTVCQNYIVVRMQLNITLEILEFKYFSCSDVNTLSLKDVLSKTLSGGTPNSKQSEFYQNGTIPWITTKILSEDYISRGEKYITEGAIKNSAAKILPIGNIVAGTRVGVGKFAINETDIAFSQDVTGLVVRKEKIDIQFLIYQLNSKPFQMKIKPLLRGTTIKGVVQNDLLNLQIVVPDKENQEKCKVHIELIKKGIRDSHVVIESSILMQKSIISQIF